MVWRCHQGRGRTRHRHRRLHDRPCPQGPSRSAVALGTRPELGAVLVRPDRCAAYRSMSAVSGSAAELGTTLTAILAGKA